MYPWIWLLFVPFQLPHNMTTKAYQLKPVQFRTIFTIYSLCSTITMVILWMFSNVKRYSITYWPTIILWAIMRTFMVKSRIAKKMQLLKYQMHSLKCIETLKMHRNLNDLDMASFKRLCITCNDGDIWTIL